MRASRGSRGAYGAPFNVIAPASGAIAPARIDISVLLPAPFCPTSAHTSPPRTARSTPSSATVPPNALRTRRISKCARQAARRFQPSRQVWLQQLLDSGVGHSVASDELRAGIDAFLDRTALKVLDHGLHTEITHVDRILHDERIDVPVAQALHERVRGVEPDVLHLAGPSARLQHAQQRERVRFVRGEDAVELERSIGPAELMQQRLASFVRAFDIGTAILIRAEHLDVLVLGDLFKETFFAIVGACRSFGITQHHDPSALREHLREPLGCHAPADAIVGGDEADVIASLQPRVDDDDGNFRARRVADRTHQRRFVERRQDDARHTARDEALDLGDLRCAIVLAKRASPDDVDPKLLRRLRRACVNALPEHVRRALWDDGDRHLAAVRGRRRAARGKEN